MGFTDWVSGVGDPAGFLNGGNSAAPNWVKKVVDPAGAAGMLGIGGGVPNNYDAKGELAKSEAMAGNVYQDAMGQTQWIAEHAAPSMNANIKASNVQADAVNAPGAINAQTIGTPSTLSGADADSLRAQQLSQAAAAANSPSSAAAQMKAAGQQVANQQLGQAAMARGPERAAMKRDAMLATGTQGMVAANQTAALAAQENVAKQNAYTAALSGVRAGDVNVGQAQTQIGAANQGANLQAQQFSSGQQLAAQQANQQAALTAAQANQQAGLQAQTGTIAAQQAGWNAQLGATNAAHQTALQAVGAQNQAQGTASAYGQNQNEQQTKQQGSIIGAGGAIIGGVLSDENAKTDMTTVGGSSFADQFSTQLAGAYGAQSSPTSPYGASQDFLSWQPTAYKAPEQNKGLLGGVLSDERTKQQVDAMDPSEIADWAEDVPGITFRYKPGIAEAPDDGERFHAGTGANALEQTGPLGKMFVTEGEDGLKKVDYGPMAFFHSKGALARADQALDLATQAYELALKGGKRSGKESR